MKFWILGGVYLQCRQQSYTNVLLPNFILFFFYFFHEACRKEIITWHCHAWVMCQLITILATYILMSLLAETFFLWELYHGWFVYYYCVFLQYQQINSILFGSPQYGCIFIHGVCYHIPLFLISFLSFWSALIPIYLSFVHLLFLD